MHLNAQECLIGYLKKKYLKKNSNESFLNEIRNDEENINDKIFIKYFGYQNPSFLAKNLVKANEFKNNQMENKAIYLMNDL